MTERVKKFIENTVDLVEQKNYDAMFMLWYTNYAPLYTYNDVAGLTEVFDVFNHAKINLFVESKKARQNIISHYMFDYIENTLNDPSIMFITLPDIVSKLNSRLGLSIVQINDIFKQVAVKLSLKRDDIILEPFKIRRK